MLYISRVAGVNKWGVTDSDDGVEQIVGMAGLRSALIAGVEIKGVEKVVRRRGGFDQIDVGEVEVWQDESQMSVRTKALVLRGVDVKLSGDRILQMSWNVDVLPDDARIRISDYGKRCENYAFVYCATPSPSQKITLVLDSKVKVKKSTFTHLFNHHEVYVDLCEVRDDKQAGYVYEEYLTRYNGTSRYLPNRVIDNPERMAFWQAVGVVYHSDREMPTPSAEIQAQVAKKFEAEFGRIANMTLEIRDERVCLQAAESYIKCINHDREFWESDCQDFEQVRYYDTHDMLRFIRDSVPCRYFSVTRFAQFLKVYTPSEAIKSYYVSLCNRVNRWAISEGLKRGWISEES